MSSTLRPEVTSPPPGYAGHLIAGSVAGIVGFALVVAGGAARAPSPAVSISIDEPAVRVEIGTERAVATETEPPSAVARVAMMFEVDGVGYMKLADLDAPPRHGPVSLVATDDVTAAIAPVAASDVARAHRAWRGKTVLVDGVCRATVGDLAVIARLVGSPDYAGGAGDTWTAAGVMDAGDRVLAARLEGCAPNGRFVRDAALSSVVRPEAITDVELARAGERAMIASAESAAAQTEWLANPPDDKREHWTRAEGTRIETRVVRHPVTGVTWVSVQAQFEGGCGLPSLNVWKLYRAGADRALTPVPTQLDEHATAIEELVDLDGDGELEVITSAWLGLGRNVNRASGESLARDHWQFFGCAC